MGVMSYPELACISRPDPHQEFRHIHKVLFFYQFWLHLYALFPTWRKQHFITFLKCDTQTNLYFQLGAEGSPWLLANLVSKLPQQKWHMPKGPCTDQGRQQTVNRVHSWQDAQLAGCTDSRVHSSAQETQEI